ncbi:MAG: hypothetical protein EA408_06840 [Marinilabiliales bacterium]|nr:MAG: hypothetical protein EA408_06840 [Marinilabiliales bacterium]
MNLIESAGNRNYFTTMFTMLLTLALLLLAAIPTYGQEEYREFYSESLRTTNTGMYVLGGWAITNIATGAYGWSRFDGDKKYFHQMNLFWNTVNLSIAGFALYSNSILDISAMGADEIMDKHTGTERILLINTALNVGYIGTGFLMRHLAGRSEKQSDLLKGYGNSVILQGSFLFVFDLVLYGILRNQRIDFMENINVALLPDGAAVRFVLPL